MTGGRTGAECVAAAGTGALELCVCGCDDCAASCGNGGWDADVDDVGNDGTDACGLIAGCTLDVDVSDVAGS